MTSLPTRIEETRLGSFRDWALWLLFGISTFVLVICAVLTYWVLQVNHETNQVKANARASRCWAGVLDEALKSPTPRAPAVHSKLLSDANRCTRFQP